METHRFSMFVSLPKATLKEMEVCKPLLKRISVTGKWHEDMDLRTEKKKQLSATGTKTCLNGDHQSLSTQYESAWLNMLSLWVWHYQNLSTEWIIVINECQGSQGLIGCTLSASGEPIHWWISRISQTHWGVTYWSPLATAPLRAQTSSLVSVSEKEKKTVTRFKIAKWLIPLTYYTYIYIYIHIFLHNI